MQYIAYDRIYKGESNLESGDIAQLSCHVLCYGPSCLIQINVRLCYVMSCHGRHHGFDRTVNSAIRSANPENPTLEPNMKWIGSPVVAEIMAIEIRHITRGSLGTPFGGKGRSYGSSIVPFERAMVVSYRLSALHCDHCAISHHSAAICHRMSPTLKSTRVGPLWGKIWEGRSRPM